LCFRTRRLHSASAASPLGGEADESSSRVRGSFSFLFLCGMV
jgi:hypothetical protein